MSAWNVYSNLDADETGVLIINGQVLLGGWHFHNESSDMRYLKFYNKSSAPTVGTDTPTMTVPLRPDQAGHVEFARGVSFPSGLGVAVTTGLAANDTGAPSTNDVQLNILYCRD